MFVKMTKTARARAQLCRYGPTRLVKRTLLDKILRLYVLWKKSESQVAGYGKDSAGRIAKAQLEL